MNLSPETQILCERLRVLNRQGLEAMLSQAVVVLELEGRPDVERIGVLAFCAGDEHLRWSHWTTSTRLTVGTYLTRPLGLERVLGARFSEFRVAYRAAQHAKRLLLGRDRYTPSAAAEAALELFKPLRRDEAEELHNRLKAENFEPVAVDLGITAPVVSEAFTMGFARFEAITGNSRTQALERIGGILNDFDDLTLRALDAAAVAGVHDLAGVVRIALDLLETEPGHTLVT
jgi:hypothetical protein